MDFLFIFSIIFFLTSLLFFSFKSKIDKIVDEHVEEEQEDNEDEEDEESIDCPRCKQKVSIDGEILCCEQCIEDYCIDCTINLNNCVYCKDCVDEEYPRTEKVVTKIVEKVIKIPESNKEKEIIKYDINKDIL